MTDLAEKTIVQSGKPKALTNGAKAQGGALAALCINYGIKRMEAEEKEQGKLSKIVASIQTLARDGHAEFRAQLTAELNLLKETRKITGVTKAQTAGYSFNSFEVLCTNWKTISTAVEMGYDTTGKPWGQVLAESVSMKNAHAANSAEGAQPPTKRKAGRKATPLIDKAITAAEALLENNPEDFVKFCAWCETTMKAMGKAPSKAKEEPALL